MAKRKNRRMGIRAAADYTGYTTHQITYACKTGRLSHYKNGTFGPFSFERADLDEWMEEKRNASSKSAKMAKA